MNNEKIPYVNVKGFKCSKCGCMEYDVIDLTNPKESIICSNCSKPLEQKDYEGMSKYL